MLREISSNTETKVVIAPIIEAILRHVSYFLIILEATTSLKAPNIKFYNIVYRFNIEIYLFINRI